MAKFIEWTKEQHEEWNNWLDARPKVIQNMAANYPGDRLYRLKTTGQRVTLNSYFEDGTVSVNITGDYNLHPYDKSVFGIKIEDLEECDLPDPNELLGTTLNQEDAEALIKLTQFFR